MFDRQFINVNSIEGELSLRSSLIVLIIIDEQVIV